MSESEATCKTCPYWVADKYVPALGDCRRHPPRNKSEWVETSATCWCGEHPERRRAAEVAALPSLLKHPRPSTEELAERVRRLFAPERFAPLATGGPVEPRPYVFGASGTVPVPYVAGSEPPLTVTIGGPFTGEVSSSMLRDVVKGLARPTTEVHGAKPSAVRERE